MTRLLNAELESLTLYKDSKYTVALNIRNFICPTVVMTQLKLTPKSIKKAYGIEIGIKDVVKLKGMFEHHQDNY